MRIPVLLSTVTSVVFALGGCDFYPEASEQPDAPDELAPECSPEITVPTPVGLDDPSTVPEPHDNTFGTEAPDPYHVRYNWPSSDPSTSAAFLWRTDLDTLATVVEYGIDGELTERVEGSSFRFGGQADGDGLYRIHEIKLCGGLQPGTTYSYRVGGDGHWSPVYTFTTPPEPGTFDTFRVAITGDSRGAYETWGQLVTQMEAHDPDFYVFSGDMVELGPNQAEWDSWFEAAGDVWTRKAFVPAHGNHEFLATNYFAQFSLPNNEEWFTIHYGDLTLLSLNDTVRDLEDRRTLQVQYMDAQLGATDAAWTMAQHHQPIYSTCTRHGSFEELRDDWGPMYDKHQVDVVLSGHNHIYERSVPIREGAEMPMGQGTLYLVTGGAGAPLYKESEDNWFGNVANPIEHYVIADFGPDGIDFVVRDLSDNIIDQWTVPR